MRARLAVLAAAGLAACSHSYAYSFELEEPGAHANTIEDAVLGAAVHVDGDAITLALTNKTDEVLQVQWNKIAIDRGDGTTTRLRPTVDLGWVEPGATLTATLAPFVVPHEGGAAAAYDGRKLELSVPVIAKREPKTYRFQLVAHVTEMK